LKEWTAKQRDEEGPYGQQASVVMAASSTSLPNFFGGAVETARADSPVVANALLSSHKAASKLDNYYETQDDYGFNNETYLSPSQGSSTSSSTTPANITANKSLTPKKTDPVVVSTSVQRSASPANTVKTAAVTAPRTDNDSNASSSSLAVSFRNSVQDNENDEAEGDDEENGEEFSAPVRKRAFAHSNRSSRYPQLPIVHGKGECEVEEDDEWQLPKRPKAAITGPRASAVRVRLHIEIGFQEYSECSTV
jgi:hypothetical protein